MNNKKSKLLEPSVDVKESIKKLYMILGVLQIFKLIMWFVNTSYESYEVLTKQEKKYSMITLWSEVDMSWINVLVIIFSVISIAICVLPIIKNNLEKRIFPVSLKIIIILSCVVFAAFYIFLIVAASEYSNGLDSEVNHKVGLTFWGYLQLISLIASVVITFKLSSKTKAIARWKKQNPYLQGVDTTENAEVQ